MYAITDTHALVWYLLADKRLSNAALAAFITASEQGNPIGVPSICLVEIVYLTEKNRIPEQALTKLQSELQIPGSVLAIVALDQHIALSIKQIDRSAVPEMPDRIIAATARALDMPLITRDHKIKLPDLKTIW